MVVTLKSGIKVQVDREDYLTFRKGIGWAYNSLGFINVYWREGSKRCGRGLHRLIMGAPFGMDVDHINGDRLDNRKKNLRICTRQQNMVNRPPAKYNGAAKEYKGVYGHSKVPGKPWIATIGGKPKQKYIGHFACIKEAARAYDKAALERYGEFAWLNFPGSKKQYLVRPRGKKSE